LLPTPLHQVVFGYLGVCHSLKMCYQYRQLFCNDEDWAVVVPMQKKADASDALNQTGQEYGILEFGLHTDNAGEESGDHTKWE